MPILIKDYKWSQTETDVIVRVQFKERITSKIDIFTHSNFIKINCSPFYFELFLLHSINEKESRCRIMENEIIFHLNKCERIQWDNIEKIIDKTEIVKSKEEIIQETHLIKEEEIKKKAEMKQEKKREEVHKEIERDGNIREIIKNIQNMAVDNEISSIELWKQKDELKKVESIPKGNTTQITGDAYKELFFKPAPVDSKPVTPRPKIEQKSRVQANNKVSGEEKISDTPEIRKRGNLTVNFSQRNFSTPSRESQKPEEMEWLSKQHEARKTIGFLEEDLRPEERNPEWLKEKGDDFMSKQNYLGAISAYSAGVRITDQYYELFLRRSAAHFAIENYKRCTDDCSSAYELLKPHCDINLKPRVECISRRGMALCRLGYLNEGFAELVAAGKLDPTNQFLKNETEKIRCKLENGEDY